VNATLPPDKGGLNKNTLSIDSEGEFSSRRIIQLAKALDLNPTKVLERITVGRSFNYEHQFELLKSGLMKVPNLGLVVIELRKKGS